MVVLGLGEIVAASMCHRRLPLVRCRRGHAGTASPCHGGISRAMCKCPPSPSPSLLLTATAWGLFPSWSLLHALHACCSILLGLAPCSPCVLLHSSGACSMLAMPTSSWLWLSSPGACAGHALLELVLAMFLYLLLRWVSSPAFTDAVRCFFKLYDLNC
jgi:hypothetical protein